MHCWVDSDDLVDPDGIDLCLGALDDDHGVAYSHRWLIDPDGRRRGSHRKNMIPYTPMGLLVSNMVFHLRLFRRDVFDAAGGVGDLSSAIDWDLNLRMAEHTGVRCVPIELYSYRVRPGRMSGTPHQARNGETAVRRAIERRGLDVELVVEPDGWKLTAHHLSSTSGPTGAIAMQAHLQRPPACPAGSVPASGAVS